MLPLRRLIRATYLAAIAGVMASTVSHARDVSEANNPLLRAPDHVLVWSEHTGASDRILEGLGFRVRKGQTYPEGIASSTIVFRDWSYLELLHFADPSKAANDAQARAELAFVAQGPGANSFAIQVDNVEAAAEHLTRQGFKVGDLTPDIIDPDGPSGPKPPQAASWRDFHFATSPVSGVELFFIQYPPEPPATAEDEARFRARTTHTNTARQLSAVWVLVANLDAEADIYRRMGFAVGPVVEAPHLNARARIARLGKGAVVLTESSALPEMFETPRRPGPRVIGISVEVENIKTAQPFLKGGKGTARKVESPLGRARLLPLTSELGFFVEFHEPRAPSR